MTHSGGKPHTNVGDIDAKDEFAWVIERDIHSVLHYWAGRNGDDWRPSHLEALRFARRADAELMLTYHCAGIGRAVEHGWIFIASRKVVPTNSANEVSHK